MRARPLQTRPGDAVERFLEAQRDRLFAWLPVALGAGVAAWFVLDGRDAWAAWMAGCVGLAALASAAPPGGRLRRTLLLAGLMGMLGCGLAWRRAESVAAPVLERTVVTTLTGEVRRVDVMAAKQQLRLIVRPDPGADALPPKLRITVDTKDAPADLIAGDRIALRARLVAPQAAAVPGGYDFARAAWFQGLGAVGKAIGPVTRSGPAGAREAGLRERLSAHVRAQISGSAGGIAAAFASGDRGGIDPADEDAMRASGLTHLLSISGLHVTAVVGAAMLLTLRLLALSPWLALRLPLVPIAAGAGAAAGVGYTLLTGAEVPTIRSCVAALLILAGLAMGREAFTLRLVAAGAIAVMLLWPESLVGPSFQLSFAAIATIVALHELGWVQRLVARREEGRLARLARGGLSLLLTGFAVEIALAPIALFHFHKSGLYGAFANIVAIPLTTFVTMPLEALALLFDLAGLGAPFWWLTGLSLDLLLGIARHVAAAPGAQGAIADIPIAAFGLMVAGGLWAVLWQGRVRALGAIPFAAGALWALALPPPDLIVTGDGKHMAVLGADGTLATLRPRAGDYVRGVLAERAGRIGELSDIDDLPGASCGADLCRIDLSRSGRAWRVLATRSAYVVPRARFAAECAAADIAVSDRRLPGWCRPRWFKADAALLARTGGLAVTLATARVETVNAGAGMHPWVRASPPTSFDAGRGQPRERRRYRRGDRDAARSAAP